MLVEVYWPWIVSGKRLKPEQAMELGRISEGLVLSWDIEDEGLFALSVAVLHHTVGQQVEMVGVDIAVAAVIVPGHHWAVSAQHNIRFACCH